MTMGVNMVILLIVLAFFAVCAGCYIFYIVDEYREEKRREKERQANRKQCPKCGEIHYNKGLYCTGCIIAEAKRRGMIGRE